MKYEEAQKYLTEKVFCEKCGKEMELRIIQATLNPEAPIECDVTAECSACDITLWLSDGGDV